MGVCTIVVQQPNTGTAPNWSNMELVLFDINPSNATNWQLHADGVLQARAEVRELETKVAECARGAKTLDKLKERLRTAKWLFSMSVVYGMYNRMRTKVVARMRDLAV